MSEQDLMIYGAVVFVPLFLAWRLYFQPRMKKRVENVINRKQGKNTENDGQ